MEMAEFDEGEEMENEYEEEEQDMYSDEEQDRSRRTSSRAKLLDDDEPEDDCCVRLCSCCKRSCWTVVAGFFALSATLSLLLIADEIYKLEVCYRPTFDEEMGADRRCQFLNVKNATLEAANYLGGLAADEFEAGLNLTAQALGVVEAEVGKALGK